MRYVLIAVLAALILGVSAEGAAKGTDSGPVAVPAAAAQIGSGNTDAYIAKYIGQLEEAIDYAERALATKNAPYMKWYLVNEADDRVLEAEHTHREALVAAAIEMTLHLRGVR